MCQIESRLFAAVLTATEQITEIPKEEILNSTTEESTDARALVVCVLSSYLTTARIARMMNRTNCGISYLLKRKYNDNWLNESNLKAISKAIESEFPKKF